MTALAHLVQLATGYWRVAHPCASGHVSYADQAVALHYVRWATDRRPEEEG